MANGAVSGQQLPVKGAVFLLSWGQFFAKKRKRPPRPVVQLLQDAADVCVGGVHRQRNDSVGQWVRQHCTIL